jgi:SP family myo-inositol transporter-like MFS transporter 13
MPEQEKLTLIPSHSSSRFLFILTFVASIGGALFGYDTGVVSGAMLLLASKRSECPRYGGFDLTSFEQEVVVDATIGGAIIGAILSGYFCDHSGRRPVMMFGSILFTAGSVVSFPPHTHVNS